MNAKMDHCIYCSVVLKFVIVLSCCVLLLAKQSGAEVVDDTFITSSSGVSGLRRLNCTTLLHKSNIERVVAMESNTVYLLENCTADEAGQEALCLYFRVLVVVNALVNVTVKISGGNLLPHVSTSNVTWIVENISLDLVHVTTDRVVDDGSNLPSLLPLLLLRHDSNEAHHHTNHRGLVLRLIECRFRWVLATPPRFPLLLDTVGTDVRVYLVNSSVNVTNTWRKFWGQLVPPWLIYATVNTAAGSDMISGPPSTASPSSGRRLSLSSCDTQQDVGDEYPVGFCFECLRCVVTSSGAESHMVHVLHVASRARSNASTNFFLVNAHIASNISSVGDHLFYLEFTSNNTLGIGPADLLSITGPYFFTINSHLESNHPCDVNSETSINNAVVCVLVSAPAHFNTTLVDTVFVSKTTTWVLWFQHPLALFTLSSLVLLSSLYKPANLLRCSVVFDRSQADVVGKYGSGLLLVDVGGTVSSLVVNITDMRIAQNCSGSLFVSSSGRVCGVVLVHDGELTASVIILTKSVVDSFVQSGDPTSDAAVYSKLISTIASLISMLCAGTKVSVIVSHIDFNVVCDGGWAARGLTSLPGAPPAGLTHSPAAADLIISLQSTVVLYTDKQKGRSFRYLEVGVVGVVLSSKRGLRLPDSIIINLLTSINLLSSTSILFVASNCTHCNMTIRSTTVLVAGMDFPVSADLRHRIDSSLPPENFCSINVTALLMSCDFGSVLFGAFPSAFLSALDNISFFSSAKTPTHYSDCLILIDNATIRYPFAYGEALSLKRDIISVLAPPSALLASTITISTPRLHEAVSDRQDVIAKRVKDAATSFFPSHVIACFSGCLLSHTRLLVVEPPTALAMIVFAALMTVTLDNTTIHVERAVMMPQAFPLDVTAQEGSATMASAVWALPLPKYSRNLFGVSLTRLAAAITISGGSVLQFDDAFFLRRRGIMSRGNVTWDGLQSQLRLGCISWLPDVTRLDVLKFDVATTIPMSAIGVDAMHLIITTSPPAVSEVYNMQCAAVLNGTPANATSQQHSLSSMTTSFSTLWSSAVGAASVVSAVFLGDVANILDAQVFTAMATSSCTSPGLRGASGIGQYFLAPLHPLGRIAAALGNVGLVGLIFALQYAAVAYLLRRLQEAASSKSSAARRAAAEPPAASAPPPAAAAPAVVVQFPHHTCTAAVLMAPGAVNHAAYLLSAAGERGAAEIVSGVVCMVCLGVGVLAWRRESRGAAVRRLRFERYRRRWIMEALLPRALPLGRWGPAHARATHGRFRGSVRPTREAWSVLGVGYSCVVQLLFGVAVPPHWCVYQWSVSAVLPAAMAVAMAAVRPGRVPLSDVFTVASCAFVLALCVCSAVARSPAVDNSTSDAADAASAVVMLLATCARSLSLCHQGYVFYWERRRQGSPQAGPKDNGRADHASSNGSLASALEDSFCLRPASECKADLGAEGAGCSGGESRVALLKQMLLPYAPAFISGGSGGDFDSWSQKEALQHVIEMICDSNSVARIL